MKSLLISSNSLSLKETSSVITSSLVCSNIYEQPILKSISLTVKLEEEFNTDSYIHRLQDDLYILCKQIGIFSIAKESNAKLKIRKGMKTALKIKIRKQNMLNFFENLTYFALHNLRDFEGFFLKSFDKKGNYTFSNFNRLAFSEIEFNENFRSEKFTITFNFFSKKKNHTLYYLKILGFPLKK